MKAFTIGRNENNDYIIDNNTVSGKHAEIQISEDLNTFTIKDLNSTNGTSVNGQNIISKKIEIKSKIQLGTFTLNSEDFYKQIHAYILKNRIDFFHEFHLLKEIETNYNKEKQNVNKYFKLKSALIKGSITIGLMVLVYNNAYVKSIEGVRMYLMLGIGTIGGLISTASISDKNVKAKLEDLYIEFSEKFHCPKCKFDMTTKSWRFWKSKKQCPKCKCNWIK